MTPLLRGLAPCRGRARPRGHLTRTRCNPDGEGFACKHCRAFVSTDDLLSGVNHRNHCPYCLWSRHLDWQRPGDRLSACKALMRPIGLTVKQERKKFKSSPGELMLIHRCQDCGRLSINRLAADDIPQAILSVYQASGGLIPEFSAQLRASGIHLLAPADRVLVQSRLFGESALILAAALSEPA